MDRTAPHLQTVIQENTAILTAEISKAPFGMTPSEYVEFRRLKRENLRDHMTDLELIFAMLGEATTTEIARTRDTQGLPENKAAAGSGGSEFHLPMTCRTANLEPSLPTIEEIETELASEGGRIKASLLRPC